MHFGSKLTQSVKESNTLYFTFDASGAAMAVLYNGTSYYYVTNIQGDVIAILDTSGTAVVEYAYDAWGNIILTTGSMAGTLGAHNPLRYRGYVYDKETGFYYLQSRYYNPEVGRFINADALVATGQGLLGNNMFAYCNNNPVNYIDPSGESCVLFAFIAATIIAGVSNAISTAISGGSVEECVVSGFIGAGSAAAGFGVTFFTGFSPWGNIAARAVSSTICDLGTTWYKNGGITGQDIATTAVDVTMDVCFSTVTYYYTDPIKDFGKQSLINSSIDASVDIFETAIYGSQTQQKALTPNTAMGKDSENGPAVIGRGYNYAKPVVHVF